MPPESRHLPTCVDCELERANESAGVDVRSNLRERVRLAARATGRSLQEVSPIAPPVPVRQGQLFVSASEPSVGRAESMDISGNCSEHRRSSVEISNISEWPTSSSSRRKSSPLTFAFSSRRVHIRGRIDDFVMYPCNH